MTNAIDANGNAVPTYSDDLTEGNDLGFTARDYSAEKVAKGHYSVANTYLSDEETNNNPEVVIRDGSRQHSNGEYLPGDLVVIEGMEVAYDQAVSLGLIKGQTLSNPSDDFLSDAENARAELQEAQQDNRHEAAQLLEAQLEVAVGEGNADAALSAFQNDIVYNGELGAETFAFAQDKLGMSEASVRQRYADMEEAGSQVLSDFMAVGDEYGEARMDFLADKAWNGTQQEQAIVRNLWFMAATGKLTQKDAAEAYSYLYSPYGQKA
ncbi:hypothetical protein [Roseivivax sp. THAF197b]|uniref:hypothetical protein n=1 Tax=Roseivivax sp. THAF197b TaxID=2588299 RepID=UPI001269371E|nr:hypothetical protein [Roseivivax sp. THAF197b]QFS82296.1 hypothetical protein FIV09_05600 [Roseivivax sp. THAF197b]